jgi:DNA-binding PadR family transcriptional regulator
MTNNELAILGLVAEQPKHGYQVEQDIESRGMRNWTEIGFSSIYHVLNKLQRAGWISGTVTTAHAEPGRSGPARKVFHVTEAGIRALREGVRQRLAQPRPRSADFDLGLGNLPVLPSSVARAALAACRDGLHARRRQVQDKWARDRQADAHLPGHVVALFARSLALIDTEISWIEKYLGKERKEK